MSTHSCEVDLLDFIKASTPTLIRAASPILPAICLQQPPRQESLNKELVPSAHVAIYETALDIMNVMAVIRNSGPGPNASSIDWTHPSTGIGKGGAATSSSAGIWMHAPLVMRPYGPHPQCPTPSLKIAHGSMDGALRQRVSSCARGGREDHKIPTVRPAAR